ncbi:MAG TPA: HAD-IIIA family hydrolase [Steroidobacteraceae bacterium]|jgi:3-deoxy-D-manno-octulosonate 8-phosphate phosphatase (KDO 8-P phosphatase)
MSAPIRLLVLDADGVLTDGRVYIGPRGEVLKVFDVRDGYGIVQLQKAGVRVAVISGRRSPMMAVRCRELGIRHLHQGIVDKLGVFARLCARLKLTPASCACVGDDVQDLPLMRAAALSFAVADAHREVRRTADIVTRAAGGRGAVREVCDHLLALRRPRRRRRR